MLQDMSRRHVDRQNLPQTIIDDLDAKEQHGYDVLTDAMSLPTLTADELAAHQKQQAEQEAIMAIASRRWARIDELRGQIKRERAAIASHENHIKWFERDLARLEAGNDSEEKPF